LDGALLFYKEALHKADPEHEKEEDNSRRCTNANFALPKALHIHDAHERIGYAGWATLGQELDLCEEFERENRRRYRNQNMGVT
jgi:hypothetical protein